MTEQFIFAVTEASQVAEVRRHVVALAGKLGFNETDAGKAAIVATEAATNLAKHAVQGEVVVRLLEDQDRNGIEILALDKGPGMVNVAQSLRDGYSTAGSPGTGMGAMSRLARSFDLHSAPRRARQYWQKSGLAEHLRESPDSMDVGVVCRAKRNEVVCGDGWEAASQPGRVMLLVVDGLGHGLGAATAAQEAIRIFRSNSSAQSGQNRRGGPCGLALHAGRCDGDCRNRSVSEIGSLCRNRQHFGCDCLRCRQPARGVDQWNGWA